MTRKPIPYNRQSIQQSDIDAVVRVLSSDFLTQGPAVEEFERATAEYCGAPHAIAVSNATAALHIACLALDVGKGDLVWTAPNSFVASSNCALYCGADVDFVDIDPVFYNISVDKLSEKLALAKQNGRLPKVVIPVHFAGHSCEMKAIHALSKQYGFKIIEDASHALGGSYENEKVGSCRYSDMTVFSYHAVKMITSGEGGMVVTKDNELARKLHLFRSHGVTRDTKQMHRQPEGPWYYEQVGLGFNYRITDIQAALGKNQLLSLDRFVARRRELVAAYNSALEGLPIKVPTEAQNVICSYHLYAIRLAPEIAKHRGKVFSRMREQGILVNVHYIPIHTQPYYESLGFKKGMFPESEAYYESAISMPCFTDLSNDDLQYVIVCLKNALNSALS